MSEEERPDEGAQPASQPLLRVVRGTPDDAELAALAAVIAAAATAAGGERPDEARRSRWADPAALLRSPVRPGPSAWRASALPG
jgi:hypothetical protein